MVLLSNTPTSLQVWSRGCAEFTGKRVSLGSSHSGRRTLAATVLAATGDVDMVQTILGHAQLDHSKAYLTVSLETIRRAYEIAL